MNNYTTLTELAKALKVSPSTVSRALSDHPRISQKTKQLVRQKALAVGFIPNKYANVLRKKRSLLIGLIVPDFTLHFYSRVVKAIESVFWDTEYSLVLGHSAENLDKEIQIVDKFINLRVDGVIAALSRESKNVDHFENFIKQGIPLVFYDRVANFLPVPKILSNDYKASYKATEHLIKTGCSTIAHITATQTLNNSNNRLYGFLDALRDNNIELQNDLILYYEFDNATIDIFLDTIIKKFPQLDGIFVFNDYIANTVVHHLLKIGKKIPDDISIIGFSEEPISGYMTPKLSTVEDVAGTMGKQAAVTLLQLLTSYEKPPEKIVLDQKLVLRNTTKVIG